MIKKVKAPPYDKSLLSSSKGKKKGGKGFVLSKLHLILSLSPLLSFEPNCGGLGIVGYDKSTLYMLVEGSLFFQILLFLFILLLLVGGGTFSKG